MYNKFRQMSNFKQILFALLIGIAVVSFWRGVWGLLDIYLLPNNLKLSLWVSLIASVVVLAGTHYIVKELT